ncbi:ThuA domain-containing protein [Agromyces sp. MMS24-K17]|uniref:ThuA domain-containing protein n=1 Tax=Agromyces sp. MMS24-K17 TaxID=3372850 RepID=UPI003754B5C0
MTERIVVLSGEGPHADPWHAFEATSAAVAGVLGDAGDVEVIGTDAVVADASAAATAAEASADASAAPTAAATAADAIRDADLLVVNASADLALPPGDSASLVDLLVARHAAGRPILALHSSSLAFGDDPRWARLLGGRWVPGTSGHPQIGHALVQAAGSAADLAPAAAPPCPGDFVLYDERYTALECDAANLVLAVHTEDGLAHPIIWWRDVAEGAGAVAYDALGHGVESYESAPHAHWLRRAARRLLATAPAAAASVAPPGSRDAGLASDASQEVA